MDSNAPWCRYVFGNRALPILWKVVKTKGTIGFDVQKSLLDEVPAAVPEGVGIMFAADRFYGVSALVEHCRRKGWDYGIRLKKDMRFSHDGGNISPGEAYDLGMDGLENAVFANSDVSTNVGIPHKKGHPEPWFIAMGSKPTEYRTPDYSMRWGIDCMFSDFKSRGFDVTRTKLTTADRIERLLLVLTVAMYWAVSVGLSPNPEREKVTEKKRHRTLTSFFKRGLRLLMGMVLSGIRPPPLWLILKFVWW